MAKKSSRMRRLLSGVLSAVMLATLVPSTAFAIGRTDTGSFLTGPYLMTPVSYTHLTLPTTPYV